VLNQVGIPKRPEIKPADFAKAIGLDPIAVIGFEPKIYGTAANNGQMIADITARVSAPFASISEKLLESSSARRKPNERSFLSKLSLRR
jgi:pilus assembly protein CpaE